MTEVRTNSRCAKKRSRYTLYNWKEEIESGKTTLTHATKEINLSGQKELSEKQHKISELDSVCGIVSAVFDGAGCVCWFRDW
jgi:hypothetical protein